MADTKPTVPTTDTPHNPALAALGSAFREGAKDGASAAIASALSQAFLTTPVASKLPAIITGTDTGKRFLTWALPPVLYGVTFAVPDLIPKHEVVRAVALRAFRGYTVVFVHAVFADLGGFFLSVAKLGDEFPQSPT